MVFTIHTGFMFSSDVVATMEKYGSELVHSVMERAEAVYKNFDSHVSHCFFSACFFLLLKLET